MKANKVVVAVSLEDETNKPLIKLKDFGIDLSAEIHLLHVVPVILYARGLHPSVLTYPLPEERPKIREAILARLAAIKSEIFPHHKKIVYECLFDSNEKVAFFDYLEKQQADLAVVATREKHPVLNFFDSSFAEYQLRHASCPLLVLR